MNIEKTTEKEPVNTPNEENQTGGKTEKIESAETEQQKTESANKSAPVNTESEKAEPAVSTVPADKEPVSTESAKAESEKAEPAVSTVPADKEPVSTESAKAESEKAEPAVSTVPADKEPVSTESAKAEPEKAEPAVSTVPADKEPVSTESAKAEPEKAEPAVSTVPADKEPVSTESAKAEPQKAEPAVSTVPADKEPVGTESAKAETQKAEPKKETPVANINPEKEAQLKAEQEAKAQEEEKIKAELEAKAQKEAQAKAQQEEQEAKAKETFEKMKSIQSLLGKKVGMTQVFTEKGDCLPVTLLQLGPVEVIQKKTLEKDGYEAIKVGFEELPQNRAKKLIKPKKGQMSKTKFYRYLREVSASEIEKIEIGQKFDVAAFQKGSFVDVIGVSKGKGFAGVIKRHNFSGGPKSHGSHLHRSTGSIGASAYPARVFKNRKMPGHYGFSRVTVQGLQVVQIIREDNLLLIKGAVPGPNGRLVEVRRAIKNK